MAFRERCSGVSFGFIFSSVSWLLVFFFRCADEEFHQSGGEVLALLLRIFCVRHIVERQVHLRRELLYRSLHLSPPWELRTLRTQHPTRNRIDFAVYFAIDAVAVTVLASRTNRKRPIEEWVPTVVDRYSLEIIRII